MMTEAKGGMTKESKAVEDLETITETKREETPSTNSTCRSRDEGNTVPGTVLQRYGKVRIWCDEMP